MNKYIVMTIMLLGVVQFTFAQETTPKANQISVIGSVELKAIADQASFTFSIKGVGSSLRYAVEDAKKKVVSLTDKLQGIGLSSKNISTSQFYSGENYGDKAFLSSSRDYEATLVTLIKIDSLRLLDTVLYTISDAEIQNLSSIYFGLKDELGLRKRARIAAAAKAKEKAEDMTNALGATVGSVVNIEEIEPTKTMTQSTNNMYLRGGRISEMNFGNPYNPPSTPYQEEQTVVDETSGSGFFAQTISITSQVRVTFEIN